MNTCIQIGLHNTCEYLYLTQDNWLELMPEQAEFKRLPDVIVDALEKQHFRYYGIDRNPASLGKLMESYEFNNAYVEWICAQIATKYEEISQHNHVNDHLPERFFPQEIRDAFFWIPSLPFDVLLENLKLEQIDVLALDIEGDEQQFFEDYSWSIAPKFISIETHWANALQIENNEAYDLNIRTEYLIDFISKQGYECVVFEESGTYGHVVPDQPANYEIQFVRKDLI